MVKTPIEAPNVIGMLLPTRGRKDYCRRLLQSIEQTAVSPELISVRGLDDHDDDESRHALEQYPRRAGGIDLQIYVAPATRTQGDR